MAARMLASQARTLLQGAVAPDLWSAAAAHSDSHSGGGSGGWGGGIPEAHPAAPAPGPQFAAAPNATDGVAAAGDTSPYMATPDTIVIVLGVAAIVLTLSAIGLRLYRSEHGCCCGGAVAAQPTAGPAAGQAPQRAAKPQQLQAPPVIVVMPNEELLCAVKDGTRSPAPRNKQGDSAAGQGRNLGADSGRIVPGFQHDRRQQQPQDAGHVPAWWVFDALSWAAPRLLLPAAPRPGMQRAQSAAAKGSSGSFCYII